MKVRDLFEGIKVDVHARLYNALNAFALSQMKVPGEIRSDMEEEAKNDRFFTSSIDEAVRAVEQYTKDNSPENLDSVMEAFIEAVDQICGKIKRYYSNRMNFGDGYKIPKAMDLRSLHADPDSLDQTESPGISYPDPHETLRDETMMEVLRAALPEFKAAHDEHVAYKKKREKEVHDARTAAATPEALQRCAEYLIKKWPAAFDEKQIRGMQKKPKLWTDWFTLDEIKAFKEPVDVQRALKTDFARLEWVLDSGRGFHKEYNLFMHIIKVPALRKKLVALIPQLH